MNISTKNSKNWKKVCMIKINPISDSLKEQFYKNALPHYILFLKKVSSDTKFLKLIEYLEFKDSKKPSFDEAKMRNLLIGQREELLKVIGILKTFENENKHANNCYSNFASQPFMRTWAKDIGVESCPYCNMNYLNSSVGGITRSEFDHYYPKSLYPYLCISLYNLVPCCHDCNHKKLNLDTHKSAFAYPFSDEFGDEIVFKVEVVGNDSITNNFNPAIKHSFKLDIINKNRFSVPEIFNNQISVLNLKEKYLAKEFDINEMYNRVIKYNKQYCSSVFKLKIFNRFIPNAYDFCGVIGKDNWIKTTMAKIKYDIFNQFKK